MKEIWNRFKNWKYFKVVLAVVVSAIIMWLIYVFFIRGLIQFRENEKKFESGVRNYYEYNPLNLPKEGEYKEHKLSEMFQGSWVESIYVPGKNRLCDGDSFIRVANENGEYRYITYLKCGKYESKTDHKAPDILLNGEETVVIHLGDIYQDAGVKEVKDNYDKIDASSVKTDTSRVNTSKMGTYEIRYQVTDKNYNTARKTRTVIVAETLSSHLRKNMGDNFRFIGTADDNYVLFSGMTWRIVKTDSDGNLVLITDNPIANVSYGNYDQEYPNSNIYKWLNEYFYSNLWENSKRYIVDANWCYDDVSSPTASATCNLSVQAKVGLLSIQDFVQSQAYNRTYLFHPGIFFMINRQNALNVWISNMTVADTSSGFNVQNMAGVKPVVYLSKDVFVTSGDGTEENPYKLQDYLYAKENDLLNTRLVGEYVVYSGYTFRVAGKDEDGNTKLIGIDLLENSNENWPVLIGYTGTSDITPDASKEGNLYYRLDQEAINYISEKSIVSHEFEIPVYKDTLDFSQYEKKKVTSKIGIPTGFEMFSGLNRHTNWEHAVYWLSDYDESGLISILNGNNGLAFRLNLDTFPENAVKPVIYVKNNLKIASGRGTSTDPYYVR